MVYGVGSASTVTIIDATTNTVAGSIPVGAYPSSVAVDDRTHELYVTHTQTDSVSVIDGLTRAVTHVAAVADAPQVVTIDSRREAAYVSHAAGGLSVIDASREDVVAYASYRGNATAASVSAKTGAVYIAGFFDLGAGPRNGLAVVTCSTVKGSRCK